MPDHFHWLIELKHASLSTVMQRTKSRAAMSIGVAQGSPLKLWQKGYHDRAIRYDEDVFMLPAISLPTPCGQAWSSVWVTTLTGMPSGYKHTTPL